jgi:hypothetical protein
MSPILYRATSVAPPYPSREPIEIDNPQLLNLIRLEDQVQKLGIMQKDWII